MSTVLYEKTGSDASAKVATADSEQPRSGLDWQLKLVTRKEFLEKYWERQPLVVERAQSDYFSNLLSLKEVDRVITTLGRRYPDIQLKNARGRTGTNRGRTGGRTGTNRDGRHYFLDDVCFRCTHLICHVAPALWFTACRITSPNAGPMGSRYALRVNDEQGWDGDLWRIDSSRALSRMPDGTLIKGGAGKFPV